MVVAYRQKTLWLQAVPANSVSGVPDNAETKFKRTLGATIIELRVEHGIRSQGDLARLMTEAGAAVSEATVRRWETGTHAPDAWEVNRLCDVFGIEPVALIHPEDLTDRELQVLRRAARQVHRTIAREREGA